jgi:hypothetical protein
MTGYVSKKAMAEAKLEDDDTQVYQDHDDALTIAYQSGFYDGKKAPQRPWVGLTDKERQDIALEVPIDAVLITEAKLKEKNT